MNENINIKIKYSGGERLYIHPIAFDWVNIRNNKVHYFVSPEFPPYKAEFYIFNDNLWQLVKPLKINRLWHGIIKRGLITLSRSHSWFYNGWWKNIFFPKSHFPFIPYLWFGINWLYKTSIPFLACAVYDGWISVPGQLQIIDPNNLTEDYYLTPSQNYLKNRVTEWLQRKPSLDDEKEWLERGQRLLSGWIQEQLSKGLEVIYLCSLDT